MELLNDTFTGLDRLVAPDRVKRLGLAHTGCPFCAGNEDATPAESLRIEDSSGTWRARAFPNLFPLASYHEVLVPTARHVTTLRELTPDELEAMLELWCQCLHAATDGARYPHLFVNDGAGAGSSVPHVHAQLMVADRSPYVQRILGRVSDPDTCAACALETQAERVWSSEDFVLAVPATPRLSGSMILAPRLHDAPFACTAELVIAITTALRALPDHDFNILLVADLAHPVHWYLEFIPRHGQLAGAELGLNLTVCIERPDVSAAAARARLRA